MLTTPHVDGAPNWVELGTPDPEAAAAFYGALFGWSFQPAGPDSGGYGFFRLDGLTVAAAGPNPGASAWTLYFQTPDADATAKAVEECGGAVRVSPFDVFTSGRMAGCTDPGGAEFALWEPREVRGLDLVAEPGSLAWTELYVPVPDAIRAFYAQVFDWTSENMPFGEMTYIVVSTAEGDDPGLGGVMPLQEGDTPHWLPYFEVSDCDEVVARARELGGRVVAPAVGAEGVGRFAELADPSGARFAVITSA
ncbi:VOC family protein [Sphaerisporangium sp. NPDC049002]|uniref:VOC family protein n=1 Tax=unclassified Sphaerisporangium TaxID=2630420 RepID=UPI0033DA1079